LSLQSELQRKKKADLVVKNLGVKLQTFKPSGREIWTVLGSDGDSLVDYDPLEKRPPYCSCEDYHFRVLGGKIPECYHLIATKQARSKKLYSEVTFSDDEFEGFLTALLTDLFSRIS